MEGRMIGLIAASIFIFIGAVCTFVFCVGLIISFKSEAKRIPKRYDSDE
jgi:hypothetical protein